MLYDDTAISHAGGESRIEQALLNEEKISIRSHDEKTVHLMYGLEHYIVKYWNHPKSPDLADKMFKRIEGLINLYEQRPDIIAYSYILSNKAVLKSIVSRPDLIRKFHNGTAKLTVNWETTYNKIMNNEPVSDVERDYLHTYFTLMINFKKDKNPNQRYVNEKIEAYVFKLLRENKVPENDSTKLFLFNYCSKFTLAQSGYYNQRRNIRLMDIKSSNGSFTGGYELESFIAMNDHPSPSPTFYHSLDQMVQCIMHETTHAIQEIQAKESPNSVHGMEMAIQKLFGYRDYQKGMNYLFNEIEENSQLNGYSTARILYGMAGNKEVTAKLLQEERDYYRGRRFQYEYVTVMENGKPKRISKERYNVTNIRQVVKNNPALLTKYPSLSNMFHSNGDSKSLEEILSEPFVSHDIEAMHKDFILYDIQNNGLASINLRSKSDQEKRSILYKLIQLIRDETEHINNILDDVEYREKQPAKTAFFYKVHMEKIIIMSTFVEKELHWMRKYEKNNQGNYELYTLYTKSIRTLLNNISKQYQSNGITNLKDISDSLSIPFQVLERNIKEEYINYLVERYSIEQRIQSVTYNGVEYSSLEEFIRTFVKANMDRDHYMRNGKYYLADSNGQAYDAVHFVQDVVNLSLEAPSEPVRKVS